MNRSRVNKEEGMRIKYARNTALFALVLVIAAPLLLFGQATRERPTPATISGEKQKLLQLQPRSVVPGKKACEPGPVQALIPPPGWFESIAVANNGDAYTSDQATMAVYRITPTGKVSRFASLLGNDYYDPQALYAGTLGLRFDRNGNLWVATLDFLDTEKHGMYRVTPDGQSELAVPMDPNVITAPNGLTFDAGGNLYVTEVVSGTIWKVIRGEHVATLWLANELLTPPPGGVYGANGIVYKDKTMFITNTDRGTILKVPLNRDGSAGEVTVFAQLFDDLGATLGPDGLILGPDGALYTACPYVGQLIRVAGDGSWQAVLDQDLAYSTDVAFGKTDGEKNMVYLSNFMATLNNAPGVVKVHLCKQ
jgi:sugar lactone lactonase YvrE